MVEIKTDEALKVMREAGRVVANALDAVRKAADVGVSLLELDEVARGVLRSFGAGSPFLNYHPRFAPTPFPAVICTSVNEMVVHAIPTKYQLQDGDLVSIDCGAVVDGWASDSAVSFVVGEARPADLALIETAYEALDAAIAAAVVGARLGDLSHAVGRIGRAAGYGILDGYGGHGIGRNMHEDPHIPNVGRPGRGLRLQHGMVLALEPMFMAGGSDEYSTAEDGWGLYASDGSRAAHVEHTVAITDDGPWVLSQL